jgi:hypothetical protein
MELDIVLSVYVIILIVLIFVFYKSGITILSSIVISIIICFILLNFLKPLSEIDPEFDYGATYVFYIFIQIMSVIIVFIYSIYMSINDKEGRVCYMQEKQTCSSEKINLFTEQFDFLTI